MFSITSTQITNTTNNIYTDCIAQYVFTNAKPRNYPRNQYQHQVVLSKSNCGRNPVAAKMRITTLSVQLYSYSILMQFSQHIESKPVMINIWLISAIINARIDRIDAARNTVFAMMQSHPNNKRMYIYTQRERESREKAWLWVCNGATNIMTTCRGSNGYYDQQSTTAPSNIRQHQFTFDSSGDHVDNRVAPL